MQYDGKVVEYDPKGQVVWQAKVERPYSAVRLPGGGLLASAFLAARVVELDREGKEVWKHGVDWQPSRVSRR